jgi:pyruvate-formate lyase-activating enzyme
MNIPFTTFWSNLKGPLRSKIARLRIEGQALLRNEAFYCKVLSGLSGYNLCINSDMTVSCNCQDYLGRGQLGTLNRQSLTEIFDGATAHHFRRELSEGRVPIRECVHCDERQTIAKRQAGFYLHHYQIPTRGIMVENTVLCNFNCLYCNRDVQAIRGKKTRSMSDVERIAHLLREHQFQKLYYFNLGETFLSRTVAEELRLIREINPGIKIFISTNGVLIDTQEKREAALLCNLIQFSLDGPEQEVVAQYQRNADFERTFKNMAELVRMRDAAGQKDPIIEWKYVVFRWNDQAAHIQEAIHLAKQIGVDVISFCPGGAPRRARSMNYHSAPHFTRIPLHRWKGRALDLRTEGRCDAEWPQVTN